jgi:hypothetical protein
MASAAYYGVALLTLLLTTSDYVSCFAHFTPKYGTVGSLDFEIEYIFLESLKYSCPCKSPIGL